MFIRGFYETSITISIDGKGLGSFIIKRSELKARRQPLYRAVLHLGRNHMNEKTIEILDSASLMFAKYGYKKTTMKDIGDSLNMTKGNLYLYFDNKDDLYVKTIKYQLTLWRNEVYRTVNMLHTAKAKFEIMCKKSFEYIHENEVLKDLVAQDANIFAVNHDNDRFIEVNQQALQMLKGIIVEGIQNREFRNVNVDNTAEFIFSSYMLFLIRLYSNKDRFATARLLDDTIDLLKHGLIDK